MRRRPTPSPTGQKDGMTMKDPKDITVNGKQLSEILEAHKNWLLDEGGQRADLRDANLSGADLRFADLRGANLRDADLRGADLRGADLRDAENLEYVAAITSILPEGDIIGWKKCNRNVIVKLLIPADAKRSNATGRKCRAEFAKVLEVIGEERGYTTMYGSYTEYVVGEIVRPDSWDENRWNECSHGIHFFITRIEAENYN